MVHHRRLFLVTPTAEEPWPRPDDAPAMTAADEGAFELRDTAASARRLGRLQDCLQSQDPQALLRFLEHHPFCVEGLLVLAEYYRGHHAPEQAFKLLRRAVYAVECGFHGGFTPFQETGGSGPSACRPRVRLRLSWDLAWPGWTWLRALWMYMQALASQGMHRTSLEVCKLMLAATMPRDPAHALLCCDVLCLRSCQYDALARLAAGLAEQCGLREGEDMAGGLEDEEGDGAVLRLDLVLPNFAYSLALAGLLKANAPPDFALLGTVAVADVTEEPDTGCPEDSAAPEDAAMHAHLLRALLLFPLALRPLLEEAGVSVHGPVPTRSPSRETWAVLLSKPPFSDAAEYRHVEHAAAHGRLCVAYAKACGALWRSDVALCWLHACAARLVGMHESPIFAADLAAARASWRAAPLCLQAALAEDYTDPLATAAGAVEAPPLLARAAQARLHGDMEEEPSEPEPMAGPGGADAAAPAAEPGPPARPTVSLHSPPLIFFFQTFLPWAELDRGGAATEALRWSSLSRGAAGVLRGVALFCAGAVCDAARLLAGVAQGAIALARPSRGAPRQ